MGKTIWFINEYAGSRYHGMEFRNYYFAKEFVKRGHSVTIISASFSHLFKKLPKVESSYSFEEIDGITYLWLKVPKYSRSTDPKRILKWFIFTKKLYSLPLNKMDKPDVIVASPMAPFMVFPAYRLAKKFGAKFFYEVKDIWPLTLQELGGFSKLNPLIVAMEFAEKFAIKKADRVISSLKNYGEHLQIDLKINKSFEWINNGIDLDEYKIKEPLPKEIENILPKDKFLVGYTGALGIPNDMKTCCEAAKILQNRKDIAFIMVGDGIEKQNLVNTYGNLDNILFIEPIKKSQVQSMLEHFDVCYIGWKKERLYNYGISPNKIFDYFYSGKPILHAYSGKGDLVELANAGITVEAQNPQAVAKGIEKMVSLSNKERQELGQNGKKYVLENFTYEKLAEKFERLL